LTREYHLSDRSCTQTTFGAGPDFAPMPDRARRGIYFVSGRLSGALVVYNARTRQSFDLVTESSTQPMLSHNGRRVAYVKFVSGRNQELWLADVDGNNSVKLASSANLVTLSFSPDGSQFAFADAENGIQRLYVIRSDGSGLCTPDTVAAYRLSDDLPWGSRTPPDHTALRAGLPAAVVHRRGAHTHHATP